MPNWYSATFDNVSKSSAGTPPATELAVLEEQFLSSSYFLGLTQQSAGNLQVRDGTMSLRVEAPVDMVLTQGGMFMPLTAPDEAFATWQLRWPFLDETEIRKLELASEAGVLTIDDPVLASCTGYISDLAYSVHKGIATDGGENLYEATVQFPVTRLEWPPYMVVPPDGSYAGGTGFGAHFNGVCPCKTTTGIDVTNGWFECTKDPHEFLLLSGQHFPQKTATFVAVVQPFEIAGWVPGNCAEPHTLFSSYQQPSGNHMAINFSGSSLSVTDLLPLSTPANFALDLTPLVGMPWNSHFLVAVGFTREDIRAEAGNTTYERYRVALGVTAWHPTTPARTVFQSFSADGHVDTLTGTFTNDTIAIGGSQYPIETSNTSLDGRVRPVNNRFVFHTYLNPGMMASLLTSYLERHDLYGGA